ncbi:ScbA/BarX family gamma-butyrolactone biosynthesis protein [Streptomyces sp. NPDC051211]|uniref:ScbA/BarX family gamma-butyrolactone biosynthesis protein n=1 Tax=Streptomyces sp. NPDC051211 TaxID=3154643 RepID=UPI00344DE4DF
MPTPTSIPGSTSAGAQAAPVPARYTHKTDAAEALLRTWRRIGPDTFAVTASWPGSHGFYRTLDGLHDPLLLGETVRQTLPFLSHAAYGVPFGHHLLWQTFAWELSPRSLHCTEPGAGAEVELRIFCHEVQYRKDRAAAIAMEVEAVRDGALLGTARTRFTIQDPAVYRRLRGPYADVAAATAGALPLAPPAPPCRVGRESFADVVLSPTDSSTRWQLRTDTAHPILFDHPVDHAPGMLLLEAVRQAALAMSHPRPAIPVAMDSVFVRYAELDAPCVLEAAPLPDDVRGRARLRVSAEQHGSLIFVSEVTLEDAPGAGPRPVRGA